MRRIAIIIFLLCAIDCMADAIWHVPRRRLGPVAEVSPGVVDPLEVYFGQSIYYFPCTEFTNEYGQVVNHAYDSTNHMELDGGAANPTYVSGTNSALKCLYYDGTDYLISAPRATNSNITTGKTFTVMGWCASDYASETAYQGPLFSFNNRTSPYGGMQLQIVQANQSYGYIHLGADNATYYRVSGNHTTNVYFDDATTTPASPYSPYLFAASYDGKQARLFQNGIYNNRPVTNYSTLNQQIPITGSNYIGTFVKLNANYYFTGYMGDQRVYTTNLPDNVFEDYFWYSCTNWGWDSGWLDTKDIWSNTIHCQSFDFPYHSINVNVHRQQITSRYQYLKLFAWSVSWYTNSANGNVYASGYYDFSGYGGPGTTVFSATDGTNDLPFSYESWLCVSNASGYPILFQHAGLAGNYEKAISYHVATKKLYVTFYRENVSTNYVQFWSEPIPTQTWVHAVFAYDGTGTNGITIYTNGVVSPHTVTWNGATYTHMNKTGQRPQFGGSGGVLWDIVTYYYVELSAPDALRRYNATKGKFQ